MKLRRQFHIALRKYSKEIEGKVSMYYVIFGNVGVGGMQSSTPPESILAAMQDEQESQALELE